MSEAVMENEGFVIDTDAKAVWALRKIREARADRDTWVKWYEAKIEEVKKSTAVNTANLEHMLAEYFASVPHKVAKTQESYTLPEGKLIMKKQQPEFNRKPDVVIDWLKKNRLEQFIKVKEELDWDGLKKTVGVFDGNVVDENGEVIPGIEVVEREPKFVVEV